MYSMIASTSSIITALNEQFSGFSQAIAAMDAAAFIHTSGGKWTPGQHLDHLLRSGKPVHQALGLPGFLLRLLFGKPNRPARSFDELVARYKEKLSAGGRASGRFVPLPVTAAQQQQLLQEYDRLRVKLTQRVSGMSDAQLDNYLLPHPLLGKLTIREMLYFTIYHTEHHRHILQNR